jgi:hypothetical protein
VATPQAQLDGFIAKYSPDVATLGRTAIAHMRMALTRSGASLQAGKRGAIVIKSISARQRPRRPASKTAKKK